MEDFLFWNNIDTIDKISDILSNGQVIVGSSDTVFGLLANTTKDGFEKLNFIKQRNTKPYIVLIDNIDKLKYLTTLKPSAALLNLFQQCWPGPLTLILPACPNLPESLRSFGDTIAVRIPNHAGLLQLLSRFDGLFSTSANLAGDPVPNSFAEIDPLIIENVAAIVLDDQLNINSPNSIQPSTILDCTSDRIKLVRAGAYSLDELQQIYGQQILS